MVEVIVSILTISLACTVLIYTITYRRRANCAYWLKVGLIFGPLAVPFVFFSKKHGRLSNF